MPIQPFPISGTCFSADETTRIASCTVYAYNLTTNESISITANSLGDFTLDLGDMTTAWSVGDKIHVKTFSPDTRFGIVRFTIASGQGSFESDLNLDVLSDIENLLVTHGEDITINHVTVSIDSNGHSTISTNGYIVNAIVQEMNGSEDEVKFGIVQLGDLNIYVSGNDYNKNYMLIDNQVLYNGSTYRITNANGEKSVQSGGKWSHFEAFARRLQ